MAYKIGGIDVHKKMLAVVVCDVEVDDEYQFARRMFGGSPEQLRALAAWLLDQRVDEVVMESTAQYWRPVWEALEMYWKPICAQRDDRRPGSARLHLALALSNRGRRGRKRDFADAEQAGAVGAAVPRLKLALMRQKGRTLHEKHREGRHADVAHAIGRVDPAPLVWKPVQAVS